jgi:hypothetical protein
LVVMLVTELPSEYSVFAAWFLMPALHQLVRMAQAKKMVVSSWLVLTMEQMLAH